MSKSSPSTTAAMKSSPLTAAMSRSSPPTAAAMKSSPTRSHIKAAMSFPDMALSPITRESHRINAERLKEDWERQKDSMKIWENTLVWDKLKQKDPETAWEHLKYVA